MNDEQMISSVHTDPRRDAQLKRRVMVILCTGVVAILCLATRFSPAQTRMELTRWREFTYARQTNQVGGKMAAIDGVHRSGFVVLGDGEFARVWSSTVHTASPEGREYYQGFVMYDFNDGSSLLAKVDVSGEPGTKQTGTIMFLSGTKRFKGVTGRGTVSSWMPAQWDIYAEIEASYSVPAGP